jgi:CheY-like chemotaxis protein
MVELSNKRIKEVLIVDDDEDDRAIVNEALGEIDKSIRCVSLVEGSEALDYLKTNMESLPGLVLLDLNMPKMDGKEFLLAVKQDPQLMHIPVTIYTTSRLKEDMEETKVLGASHFISKPTNFNDLMTEIKRVLNDLEYAEPTQNNNTISQ